MAARARERLDAAFVLPSLNGGGAERAVLNLHGRCALRTRVIVERAQGDLRSDPLAEDVVDLDLPPGSGRLTRIAALARALRELRPAVVVAVLSPLTGGLAARASGTPAVFWLQNPPYFMPGIRERTRRVDGRLGLRALAGLADAVAGATPGLCDEWAAAGVARRKLTVLPNGLELPATAPQHRRIEGGSTLRLLSIGRLAEQKRHDILIRALAEILSRRSAQLTILGRGPLEAPLRELARSLGVADRVHLPGFRGDPAPYLAAADIFVLASDFEGFGNVIVEALAHGLPAVCTDAPYGPRFIAGDCRAVTLVARRDPGELARAVLSVAAEERAGRAGEAHARAHAFSLARVSAHFEALVERVRAGGPLPVWNTEQVPSCAAATP